MSSGVQRTMRGSFLGTGALIEMRSLDFLPRSVKLYNTSGNATLLWIEGMADGSGFKTATTVHAVAVGTTPDVLTSTDVTYAVQGFVTTGGVTPKFAGFDIGTDADINVAGERIYFEASE